MRNFLMGMAGLFVVCAAYKYAAETMVKKAIELSENGDEGYKLEFKELEIPETHFEWNGGNLSGGGNQGQANWDGGE